MQTNERRCGACRWWDNIDPHDGGNTNGFCRRHAPRPVVVPADFTSGVTPEVCQWPLTQINEWCGEWEGDGNER